jgi:DNA-binding MarR family transcriptional regulator
MPPRSAPAHRGPSTSPGLDELLVGAAGALRRRWASGLGSDLTPHDARALHVVGHHGPTRLGLVAERLRISPRSVTDVVDRLEERGLVTRAPDPADRRAMTVSLTSRGEAVLARVDAARGEEAAEFFGVLTDDERSHLATLLARLDPREP